MVSEERGSSSTTWRPVRSSFGEDPGMSCPTGPAARQKNGSRLRRDRLRSKPKGFPTPDIGTITGLTRIRTNNVWSANGTVWRVLGSGSFLFCLLHDPHALCPGPGRILRVVCAGSKKQHGIHIDEHPVPRDSARLGGGIRRGDSHNP